MNEQKFTSLIQDFEKTIDDFDTIPEFLQHLKSNKTTVTSSNPIEVTIKDNQLDINKIVEYQGEELKKFEFRPETLDQFI